MTLFIFSNLVAGGGWHLDEETCGDAAGKDKTYLLLTKALNRAAVAHANIATIFYSLRVQTPEAFQQRILQVLGGPNPASADDAINAAKAMFSGGDDPTSANPPRYLHGLRTVKAELSKDEVNYNPGGVVERQCLSHKLRLRR